MNCVQPAPWPYDDILSDNEELDLGNTESLLLLFYTWSRVKPDGPKTDMFELSAWLAGNVWKNLFQGLGTVYLADNFSTGWGGLVRSNKVAIVYYLSYVVRYYVYPNRLCKTGNKCFLFILGPSSVVKRGFRPVPFPCNGYDSMQGVNMGERGPEKRGRSLGDFVSVYALITG